METPGTPPVTARRNLSHRIEQLLQKLAEFGKGPTAWQSDTVQHAIKYLEVEEFERGEATMARAERPDLHEPKSYAGTGAPADVAALTKQLEEALKREARSRSHDPLPGT